MHVIMALARVALGDQELAADVVAEICRASIPTKRLRQTREHVGFYSEMAPRLGELVRDAEGASGAAGSQDGHRVRAAPATMARPGAGSGADSQGVRSR